MTCTGAHAACRGGVNGIVLAVLFVAVIAKTKAMNVAHKISGWGEKGRALDEQVRLVSQQDQSVSLESKLHSLVKELDEHRGKHYYAEHARLVRVALDRLNHVTDQQRVMSRGSRNSKRLRSDIQRAVEAMPRARDDAVRALQAAQDRGLLNRSHRSTYRRNDNSSVTFWMEEDPRYRFCGKYAFQAGAGIEWALMSPDEGVPTYGADPNFMVTLSCVSDHGSILGLFDAVTCPLCLLLQGGYNVIQKLSEPDDQNVSLLELDHKVAFQDRVIKSSVGLYHKMRSTGILDEINFKTPLTLGFEWPRWFNNLTLEEKFKPDILLATTIGADWLAQPGYYNQTKWWPIRGEGLATYDPESPEAISGLSLEWCLYSPEEEKVSPDPNIIITLSSGLPWKWPSPLSYALNFEWPKTQEAEEANVYKNWMPEVLFGISAGYELKGPSDAQCQPVHCKWCLLSGECKDNQELNGMSEIFDDSTAGMGACHALKGTWCNPCFQSNWTNTSLEGCNFGGNHSFWKNIFGE